MTNSIFFLVKQRTGPYGQTCLCVYQEDFYLKKMQFLHNIGILGPSHLVQNLFIYYVKIRKQHSGLLYH